MFSLRQPPRDSASSKWQGNPKFSGRLRDLGVTTLFSWVYHDGKLWNALMWQSWRKPEPIERGGEEAQNPKPHTEIKQHNLPENSWEIFENRVWNWRSCSCPRGLQNNAEMGVLGSEFHWKNSAVSKEHPAEIHLLAAGSFFQCLLQSFQGFFHNLHFLPWKCYFSSTFTSLADNTAHYMQAAGPDLTDVFIPLCVGPEWGITWDSSFKLGESS